MMEDDELGQMNSIDTNVPRYEHQTKTDYSDPYNHSSFPRAHIGIGWLTTVPRYGFGAHTGWEEQNKGRLTSSTSSALVSG